MRRLFLVALCFIGLSSSAQKIENSDWIQEPKTHFIEQWLNSFNSFDKDFRINQCMALHDSTPTAYIKHFVNDSTNFAITDLTTQLDATFSYEDKKIPILLKLELKPSPYLKWEITEVTLPTEIRHDSVNGKHISPSFLETDFMSLASADLFKNINNYKARNELLFIDLIRKNILSKPELGKPTLVITSNQEVVYQLKRDESQEWKLSAINIKK